MFILPAFFLKNQKTNETMKQATLNSGAFRTRRYSNEDTTGGTNNNSFDWSLISGWINGLGGIVTGLWGKSDKYVANMYGQLYDQQKKTNTVLWVVIGLVIALGVFLVVRKTK